MVWLGTGVPVSAQSFRNGLLNRPYADGRAWHLGFSVGMHTQDIQITHNGFTAPDGGRWFIEQPSFSPGFCVSGLVAFRLNTYFSVRLSPGLYFGSRELKMTDTANGGSATQTLKSTYLALPVDLKFASQRYRNVRPYMTGGVMPAIDLTKRRRDPIQLTTGDVYLTVGLGCDFYLPYFKFIPELKFCFGLADILRHDRLDLADDPDGMKFTNSIAKATSRMVVLTFYFE